MSALYIIGYSIDTRDQQIAELKAEVERLKAELTTERQHSAELLAEQEEAVKSLPEK